MNAWTDCNVVSTMAEGKWRYCLQLLQYSYITLLWICGMAAMLLGQGRGEMAVCLQLQQYCYITLLWQYGLTAVLLVQSREEMAVLPAVTAVLSHPLITI